MPKARTPEYWDQYAHTCREAIDNLELWEDSTMMGSKADWELHRQVKQDVIKRLMTMRDKAAEKGSVDEA